MKNLTLTLLSIVLVLRIALSQALIQDHKNTVALATETANLADRQLQPVVIEQPASDAFTSALSGNTSVQTDLELMEELPAIQTPNSGQDPSEDCPRIGAMGSLCSLIGEKTSETQEPHRYNFRYQRVIYEAACADYENDTDEELSRKVNLLWERYGKNLKCGPMSNPSQAQPLKYAASGFFDFFIQEALYVCKIDLNQVEADGTVLDYLERQIANHSGETKLKMQKYYRQFREMGAKHQRELE